MTPQPTHILVVDDEPARRFTLKCVLEQNGYVVATASDGIEAVTLLQRDAFDVVLLDANMPGVNGMGLAHCACDIQPMAVLLLLTETEPLESGQRSLIGKALDSIYKATDPEVIVTHIAAMLAVH